MSETELREFCFYQLEVFLMKDTKYFVEILFETLKTKSYLDHADSNVPLSNTEDVNNSIKLNSSDGRERADIKKDSTSTTNRASTSGTNKTWSSVTSSQEDRGQEHNFLVQQSPVFPQDFPKLADGSVPTAGIYPLEPGTSFRPQNDSSSSSSTDSLGKWPFKSSSDIKYTVPVKEKPIRYVSSPSLPSSSSSASISPEPIEEEPNEEPNEEFSDSERERCRRRIKEGIKRRRKKYRRRKKIKQNQERKAEYERKKQARTRRKIGGEKGACNKKNSSAANAKDASTVNQESPQITSAIGSSANVQDTFMPDASTTNQESSQTSSASEHSG